jgi:hypothetical protein
MSIHHIRVVVVWLCGGLIWLSPVSAEEPSSKLVGNQTVGMIVGGMLPVRVMDGQSSKLNGIAVHPSWQIVLTDPIGNGWWRGSIALGVEAAFLGIAEPTSAYGVGVTPKVVYTFTSFGRLKPYVEGGGGPIWTNFDGRIPEQGSDFNFLVWGGAGANCTMGTERRTPLQPHLQRRYRKPEWWPQLPAAFCRSLREAFLRVSPGRALRRSSTSLLLQRQCDCQIGES